MKELLKNIKVEQQGKAKAYFRGNGWWAVFFPDGSRKNIHGKGKSEKEIKKWFEQRLGGSSLGLGVIEWQT